MLAQQTSWVAGDNAGPHLSSLDLPGLEIHSSAFSMCLAFFFLLEIEDVGDLGDSDSIVAIGKQRVICN